MIFKLIAIFHHICILYIIVLFWYFIFFISLLVIVWCLLGWLKMLIKEKRSRKNYLKNNFTIFFLPFSLEHFQWWLTFAVEISDFCVQACAIFANICVRNRSITSHFLWQNVENVLYGQTTKKGPERRGGGQTPEI